MATAAEIQVAYKAIYRTDLNATVAQAIASTGITVDAYVAQELPKVASTTQAAVAITAFITGVTPSSAQLDALKVAADAQVASYTKLGVGNPALGAFEAFGRGLATDATTTATFNTKYGALSTADFITTVYAQVYGATPSAGAAANLTAQIAYFTNLYTANNVPNAALAAKGAVLGQIVGYAFTTDAAANSTLDNSVVTFLTAAATGATSGYAAALPVTSGSGTPGAILTLTTGADVVDVAATNLSFKSTAGDDTIRALGGNTLNTTDVVNGGAGIDTLVATDVALAAGTSIAPVLNSVEKIFVAGAGATAVLNLSSSTGVQQVWSDNTGLTTAAASTVAVTGIGFETTVGVKGTAANASSVTATFKNVAGTNDTGLFAYDGTIAGSTITANGVENASISVAGSSAGTFTSDALKTVSLSNAAGSTGNINLTLGNVANVTTVDASALKGSATIAFTALKDVTATGGAGNDSITLTATTTEKFTVNGGAGNDVITTGVNNDTIVGGDGNDVIQGNAGADAITLGAGNDVVKYVALTDSVFGTTAAPLFDTIADFKTAGSDVIQLSGLGLALVDGANQITGQNAVSALGASATVTDAASAYFTGANVAAGSLAGFFSFQGNTYVVANDGTAGFDTSADLLIKLTGSVALSAADFSLV